MIASTSLSALTEGDLRLLVLLLVFLRLGELRDRDYIILG